MKKNGFTLIEILAVIIILGVIMIIAIPAVSKYILKSDKSVYASNVHAYMETVKSKYEMKEYGAFLKDDEIMVVPISHIVLEKGDSTDSPYGKYDFDRSHILIVPERNGYEYYATVMDSARIGFINTPFNKLDEKFIEEDISVESYPLLNSYNLASSTYTYKENTYKRSAIRSIDSDEVSPDEKIYVFKLQN